MNASVNRRSGFHNARELGWTLAWLRICAVAGQCLTVLVVAFGMRVPLPMTGLLLGIAALLAFALFAFWRLARPWPMTAAEAVAHIAVDTAALSWLLYLTGGATNPFVSLLIMPISLAAAALPLRHVVAVALIAVFCYAALIQWHVPLPVLHDQSRGDFNLHILGMAINFVITAAALGFFISRLALMLRRREDEIQRERERALRDEGILAIATQAAGTAHELNTPLSTMRTLLAELRREHSQEPALADDLALLAGQAERCRDILRELVAVGSRQLAGTPQKLALSRFVHDCEARFHLLRPEVTLNVALGAEAGASIVEADPSLHHALINLLSNAADASLAAGSERIELAVDASDSTAEFTVRDFGTGTGTDAARIERSAFRSSKRDGLGIGLALAHATAERIGGELHAEPCPDGGLLQRLSVPLRPHD